MNYFVLNWNCKVNWIGNSVRRELSVGERFAYPNLTFNKGSLIKRDIIESLHIYTIYKSKMFSFFFQLCYNWLVKFEYLDRFFFLFISIDFNFWLSFGNGMFWWQKGKLKKKWLCYDFLFIFNQYITIFLDYKKSLVFYYCW